MKKGLLLCRVDREDLWVKGFVFSVSSDQSYEDSFNEIVDQLYTNEFAQKIVETFCLEDDLFGGDETFRLINARWSHCKAAFTFRNENGSERDFYLSPDYVTIYV